MDEPNNEGRMYINGTREDDSTEGMSTDDNNLNRLGESVEGGRNFGGVLDNPIWYDQILTESEFADDYNTQPWS